jgi:hypothetical protein
MDSTKNFLEAWISTSGKLVDNLIDTSKKIQESLKKGDVVEKSVDLYKNWFDKQKNLTDSVISTLQDRGKEKMPEFVKDWMDSQVQLSKRWLDFFSQVAQQKDKTQTATDYIQTVQKMYADWSRNFQQIFPSISSVAQNIGAIPSNISALIDNTRTYMKMYEMWQPIYKMMQSNTMGIDALPKMMDMDKYREVMDGMFQFMNPEKSQSLLAQAQKYSEMFMGNMPQMPNLFGGAVPQLNGFFDKNLSSLAQISQQFSEQFHQFINPYFTMIPASPEKDMAGLVMAIQDKFAKYYVKAAEIQQLVYGTGQKTMEKAVKTVMEKARTTAELISFDDFYAVWVEMMETDMIALLGSDGYSKLQAKLVQTGLEIKTGLEAQMEQMLAPIPVVPRSEMDELNATVHELKNKVRALEGKLKESTQTSQPTEDKKEEAIPVENGVAKTQSRAKSKVLSQKS